ncbi:MAG TPA: hypothetical protein VLU25_15115 [Acidobacteriota bacterium]|nr:hypothetical protein [Acidobacteriota bacterium]
MKRHWAGLCGLLPRRRGLGLALGCLAVLWTVGGDRLLAQCPLDTPPSAPQAGDGGGLLSFDVPDPQAIQTQGQGRQALQRLEDFLTRLDAAAVLSLDYPKRRELLEKHRQVEAVYRRIGRDFLQAEDWLAKATLSLYHALIPSPDQDRRDILALSSNAVADFNHVIQAVRSIEANQGRNFDSYSLAEQLGLDVLDPVPDFMWLKRFVELAVLVAAEHPRYTGPLGTNLGRLICAASRIYTDPSDQAFLNRAHALLVEMDAGRLAEAQALYRFDSRLTRIFSLPESDWGDRSTGACSRPGPVEELPAYQVTEEFPALPEETLRHCLAHAEELFRPALQDPAEVLEAARFFGRYGDFLVEEAEFLINRASRAGEAFHKRLFLMERAFSAYLEGIRLSPATGREDSVDRLRALFQRHVSAFGQELFWAMHWSTLVELLEDLRRRATQSPQGGPLLRESQLRTIHGLLARTYSMLGNSSKAVYHLVRGDVDRQRLEEDRREFGAFGIRPGPRPDPSDGNP